MVGQVPHRIGPYEILEQLAAGGFGNVYLACRRGPNEFKRLVAIKRVRRALSTDPDIVTMFLDEARIASRIHHANVVPVLELGLEEGGGAFAVMDFIEGMNVTEILRRTGELRERVPRPVVVRFMLDLLAGLHASHEVCAADGTPLEVVHRDVSPGNVLVGYDGVARLTDFGVAWSRRASATIPRAGKLHYMAPEQIEGGSVDRTSDVFAAGIVFWELLTGQPLFPGEPEVDTVRRVCRDPIPSPRTVDAALSPELEQVCAAALERVRKCRFRTAAEFAEALEDAARGAGGIATQRAVAAFMASVAGVRSRRPRPATHHLQVPVGSTVELPAVAALGVLPDAEDTVEDEGAFAQPADEAPRGSG
jgi:serine/threonine-protein kinase